MNANNNAMPTGWTDPDDAPELADAFFEQVDEFDGERLVKLGRTRADVRKVQLTVHYDAEVVETFHATGNGWQGRMNEALKDWLKQRAARSVGRRISRMNILRWNAFRQRLSCCAG